MKKVISQSIIFCVVFFGLWGGLAQVNWRGLFRVEEKSQSIEKELGQLLWESIKDTQQEVTDKEVVAPVDSILTKLCQSNEIERKKIKLHIVEDGNVNAFALPDGYMVINSALIEQANSPEELCGVMAHELAHIELRHSMNKLVKELGLATLIGFMSGNGNIAQVVHHLSSTAFSRQTEEEADLKAIEYLTHAQVSAEPLATFMYKMSERENKELSQYTQWFSTHPQSEERAKYIIEHSAKWQGKKFKPTPLLHASTWQTVQEQLKEKE